jgi:hypothetical protein
MSPALLTGQAQEYCRDSRLNPDSLWFRCYVLGTECNGQKLCARERAAVDRLMCIWPPEAFAAVLQIGCLINNGGQVAIPGW